MAVAVEYLPGARRDFDDSFDWYAKRSGRAAIGFVLAVDAATDSIAADPRSFSENVRGMSVLLT